MYFLGHDFQKLEYLTNKQTTNATKRITTAAFAGGETAISTVYLFIYS